MRLEFRCSVLDRHVLVYICIYYLIFRESKELVYCVHEIERLLTVASICKLLEDHSDIGLAGRLGPVEPAVGKSVLTGQLRVQRPQSNWPWSSL